MRLLWVPLGAGGRFVRANGRLYESLAARRQGRPPQPLFHSALEVDAGATHHVIEMAPVWNLRVAHRGAVVEGPVGAQWLGHLRAFTYEVRCWEGGFIPDAEYAVDDPLLVSDDPAVAVRVLAVVPTVPALTWGRDELRCGDMWNSNSLISWALARAGVDVAGLRPPLGGRAPGWDAGVALAARQAVPRQPAQEQGPVRTAVAGVGRRP